MSDINAIRTAKFVSGEMFDLTAASFNNDYGAEHNQCVIKHGINFPLSKFITELSMIIASTTDDKTSKRQARLDFLLLCEGSNEVKKLFSLFTNYLNGGGTTSTVKSWKIEQYYNNFIVLTAAGGNIIILFAQLIVDMINIFTHKVNSEVDPTYAEKVTAEKATAEKATAEKATAEFISPAAVDMAESMFSTTKTFDQWDKTHKKIIDETYTSLTKTNKKLLLGFQTIIKKTSTAVQLCFIIVKYFYKKKNLFNIILAVAKSNFSDFDFKLSPNIHPSLLLYPKTRASTTDPMDAIINGVQELSFDKVDRLTRLLQRLKIDSDNDGEVSTLINELFSKINSKDDGGFLLFRVKTLIDCSQDYKKSKEFKEKYTTIELKKLQRDCVQYLDKKAWCLYPQIMQESYFKDVPPDSDCWKFLNYLYQKKENIREATQYSIDKTVKLQMAGYFKKINSDKQFPVISPAENTTEAVISYINNITYHMNKYIEMWEKVNDKGENILSSSAAPGLHEGGLPANFSHESVCFNFLSLDSILNEDSGLIARLSADIINWFLNYPDFHTEVMLDFLIEDFNYERKKLTKKESNCFMPPADLLAVPTSKKFNESLRNIKEILDGTRYSGLGYPDGIRITLNAIKTEDKIGDTQLDSIEKDAHTVAKCNKLIQIGYTSLPLKKKSESTPEASSAPLAPLAPSAPSAPSAPLAPLAPSAPSAPLAPLAPLAKGLNKQKKQKLKSLKLKEQKKPKSLKLKEQKKPQSLKLKEQKKPKSLKLKEQKKPKSLKLKEQKKPKSLKL